MTIASENALTGAPSTEWAITGAGDTANVGFAREFSVNAGSTINLSCHGAGTVIDIYRIGYYGGLGWRKVATVTNTATTQPAPATVADTNGGTTCTAWSTTASWAVPAGTQSGLFVGVYRNSAANNASYVPFLVRNDSASADIIYLTSDSTWALAYNYYGGQSSPSGGKSLYGVGGIGTITDRAHYVTYHRPIVTRENVPQTYWMACEQPLIRWLERNGYNVKYVSCKDLEEQGKALLTKAPILLVSGHAEYWSANMRTAVENWRDQNGGRSIFMAANEVFWKVRYTGDRTGMYCYKDTMPGPGSHTAGAVLDPVSWTGTWRDQRQPGGGKGENLLTGTWSDMNGVNDLAATIAKNPYAGHSVWGNTALNDGDLSFPAGIIGFEADSVRPAQPQGAVKYLAAYTRNINGAKFDDPGQTYTNNGDLTWGIVAQRYGPDAVTVGFGTCQWAWMLDATHDRGGSVPVQKAAQQFTLNLLADFGAQPSTRQSDLAARVAVSLDEYGADPATLVTDPGSGIKLGDGTALTVKLADGTAMRVTVSA